MTATQTDKRLIPPNTSDTPTFKILKADGKSIDDKLSIISVRVTKQLGKISEAIIVLHDGDVSKEDFEVSNKSDFITGEKLEIKAGYVGKNTTIFKGMIVKHGINMIGKTSVLTLTLKHAAFQMTTQRRNHAFRDQNDTGIIEDIVGLYKLKVDVPSLKVKHVSMLQYQCTDWDFINLRAEANGCYVALDNEKLNVIQPKIASKPKLTLQYGATLKEFEANMDARPTFSAVKTEAWDAKEQATIKVEATSKKPTEIGNFSADAMAKTVQNETLNVHFSTPLSNQEMQEWANARLQRSELAKIRGKARSTGFADLEVGDTLRMSGVGKRFNGDCFVSGVCHELVNGTWEMVIEFGLDEQPYSEWYDNLHEPPASGLTAAIVGLQVGVVSSIEDPKGEFRVLVKMPILGTEEAVWARLGVLDAGNKRGAYFMPEVGDEVIMGFIGNDARQAVILGSLHSSGKHPTPLSPKKENHEKGFVSRSGLRFLFNDDKKSVIIETPEGNRLSITEKDKNKIKIEDKDGSIIEMTGEGITIESAGNLTLKAKKNIVIEGQKLSLKGKISGSFDGGTSLKLSGGMIDIN